MKRNIFHILLTVTFLLSSCGGNAAQPKPMANPVIDTSPSTPSPRPTTTQTTNPTATLTASITPLPTIPTFTPTFDARTIVTVTPASPAECPAVNTAQNPDMGFMDFSFENLDNRINAEENILKFLNTYGPEPILNNLRYTWKKEDEHFAYKDLTNDRVPELVMGVVAFYIFGCKEGKYEKIFELPPDGYLHPPSIFSIKDNNRNGIPEFTLLMGVQSQGGHAYAIFEWNQSTYHNLVLSNYPDNPEAGGIWVEATGKIHYDDVNHDFVNELILNSGIPVWETYHAGLPWRNKRTIYQWNGLNYVPLHHEFASPEFRFQAVQDGDLATNQFEYEKALSLYQEAIFSDSRKSYSIEIRDNLREAWISQIANKPLPTPYLDDFTEYPRLAAYAYYRIVLLHTVRGYESDAGTVYNTLQQKFSADPYGRPYVEMATAFWDVYQSTHNMYDGCTAAIQYADEHSEILVPLGSDYHGWQSHTYMPADVCPFR